MKSTITKAGLFLIALTAGASGKTITVNTPSDGGSPLDGLTTLREAVGGADSGDTIAFSAALSGKVIVLTEGQITVSQSLTIASGLPGLVTISPNKLQPSRIFSVEEGVGLSMSRLRFSGASSGNDGGAIWNAGQVTFNDCEIVNNSANQRGGAIHNEGGTVTLNSCLLSGNTAGRGGAVSNFSNGALEVADCVFEGNEAEGVEGFYSGGGAILAEESSTFIRRSRFEGNLSANAGLALATEHGGLFRVEDSIVAGSEILAGSAEDLAAISAYLTDLYMQDCSVQGNGGVGFHGLGGGGENTLVNCTFSGNADSAVVAAGTNVDLVNCLVWNNRSAPGVIFEIDSVRLYDAEGGRGVASYTHSLVQGFDLTGVGVGNFNGIDQGNDPGFAIPIAPEMAPTVEGDLTPNVNSTLLDRGDSSRAGGLTDAGGNQRVYGVEIDLGAFEVQQKVIYVDQSVGGAGDGFAWESAFATFSEGLLAAGAGDVIRVAEGVYVPDEGPGRIAGAVQEHFRFEVAMQVFGGYPAGGGERDPGEHTTVLSGDLERDDLNFRGVTVSKEGLIGVNARALIIVDPGVGEKIVFDGVAVSGADGRDLNDAAYFGALAISSGETKFVECRFVGNQQLGVVRDSKVDFERCEISRNAGLSRIATFFDSEVGYTNTKIEGNEEDLSHEGGSLSVTNVLYAGNTGRIRVSQEGDATFVNLTASGNFSAPVDGVGGRSLSFANCLIWNNSRLSGPEASLLVDEGLVPEFSFCLLQHHDLTGVGVGNLNGTDPLNNPGFREPNHVDLAPTMGGSYELSFNSPAIDAGDVTLNPELLDLSGYLRVQGDGINLGAYEAVFIATDLDGDLLPDYWEVEHSGIDEFEGLDPNGDEDGDGLNNLSEFVHGLDPRKANRMSEFQWFVIVEEDGDRFPAIAIRSNPVAVNSFFSRPEWSPTMEGEESWTALGFQIDRGVEPFVNLYRRMVPLDDFRAGFFRVRIGEVAGK